MLLCSQTLPQFIVCSQTLPYNVGHNIGIRIIIRTIKALIQGDLQDLVVILSTTI